MSITIKNLEDFRADQIQTKQIIVTGSAAGTTKLLIYGIEAQGSPRMYSFTWLEQYLLPLHIPKV